MLPRARPPTYTPLSQRKLYTRNVPAPRKTALFRIIALCTLVLVAVLVSMSGVQMLKKRSEFKQTVILQKDTSRQVAAGSEIVLNFDPSDNYGIVQNEFGFDATQYFTAYSTRISQADRSSMTQVAAAIKQQTQENSIFLRVVDPDISYLEDAVSETFFKWYFTFTDNTHVETFAESYFAVSSSPVIFDLQYVDIGLMERLKSSYPDIVIHAGNVPLWPRDQVKEIFEAVQPPLIEAVSFKLVRPSTTDVFGEIKLMFDTMYDATGDIAGSSAISIHYPENAALSVSEMNITDMGQEETFSVLTGYISGGIVAGVQRQGKSGKAPIKYLIIPYSYLVSSQGSALFRYINTFVSQKPALVWPWAIPENGEPYDNSFFSDKNAKPFVGVIGKIPEGLLIILTNASAEEHTAKLPDTVDITEYDYFTTNASGALTYTSNTIHFRPYETVVFMPFLDEDYEIDPKEPTATPSTTLQTTKTPTKSITPTCGECKQTTTPTPTSNSTRTPTPPIAPSTTVTPIPSRTPTLPHSLTPTATTTSSQTPTVTLTRIAHCDSACGPCGWKNTQGTCYPDGQVEGTTSSCCYHTCIEDACKLISGIGSDSCSSDSDCLSIPATPYIANATTASSITYTPSQGTNPPTRTHTPTSSPPVSGNAHWALLILVPLLIIVGGVVL